MPVRHVRTDRGKEARRESQKLGQDNTPYGEGFREYVPSKEPVTGTVTTGINKDALIGHNTRIRRLTPVECERLQGFPDNWTEFGVDGKPVSNTQRYKCLGNAVTVNVIEFLGHMLKKSLFGVDPHSQSISNLADRSGQSEPIGTHNDAKATIGASPCPTDLSSNDSEGT